jgi:uncharacterized delta-60 repeat protein
MLSAAPALAAPADIDTTFGAPNGFVVTGVSGGNVGTRGLVIDPSTGNYIVGADEFIGANESMGAMQYLPSGALDMGFGGDDGAAPGTAFFRISGQPTSTETDFVRQPDGALVLGGYAPPGEDEFALIRLTPTGHLDTSFNPAGTEPGAVTTDISATASDRISALAIQSSGKIVAIGSSGGALAFARYNTNGTIDGAPVVSTFTGIGSVTVEGAVVEPDDKILVGGDADIGGVNYFMVARLTADGSPDSTFGNGGVVTFTVGNPASRDFASSIALQPDGDALIAGEADADTTGDFVAARLTPGGDFDPSFGSGGVSILSLTPEQDEVLGMTLQPNGKIILVGKAGGIGEGSGDLTVARLLTNGGADPTFGTGGAVIHPLPPSEPTSASGVAVQGDGKIVTSGFASSAGHGAIAVARFLGGEVPPPPPPPARDTVKPKISRLKLLTTHLRTIRKTKALKVRVHLSEAGSLTLKVTISVKLRHHKARTITLARSKTIRFTKAATKTITLKLSRSARSRLSKLHPPKIKITVSAKDLAGNRSSRALSATLKRG